VSRGPAIWATVLALGVSNAGVAASIVILMGAASMPLWAGLAITAVGVIVLVIAVRLWQRYLNEVRSPAAVRHG